MTWITYKYDQKYAKEEAIKRMLIDSSFRLELLTTGRLVNTLAIG